MRPSRLECRSPLSPAPMHSLLLRLSLNSICPPVASRCGARVKWGSTARTTSAVVLPASLQSRPGARTSPRGRLSVFAPQSAFSPTARTSQASPDRSLTPRTASHVPRPARSRSCACFLLVSVSGVRNAGLARLPRLPSVAGSLSACTPSPTTLEPATSPGDSGTVLAAPEKPISHAVRSLSPTRSPPLDTGWAAPSQLARASPRRRRRLQPREPSTRTSSARGRRRRGCPSASCSGRASRARAPSSSNCACGTSRVLRPDLMRGLD